MSIKQGEGENATWYKVNKNSFIKRMNPSGGLIINKAGICQNFDSLVQQRSCSLEELKEKSTTNSGDGFNAFELQVLHQLSKMAITNHYKRIQFISDEHILIQEMGTTEPTLMIYYGKIWDLDGLYMNKSFYNKELIISKEDYKQIVSGKAIPNAILHAIKDEKLKLPEGNMQIEGRGARCTSLNFDVNTKYSDIERFLINTKRGLVTKNGEYTFRFSLNRPNSRQIEQSFYQQDFKDVGTVVSLIKSLNRQ